MKTISIPPVLMALKPIVLELTWQIYEKGYNPQNFGPFFLQVENVNLIP
jgi:hypothetical protein